MKIQDDELYEAVMLLIGSVKPSFTKDGNMFCFLLGNNLQEGICGFGKTGWEAARNFYMHFHNETT
jgi:hypothetical protein